MANLDPKSLALAIFGKPGFFTKLTGEVAYVVKCKPHGIQIRETGLYFNEAPIWHDGKPKFLTPRSHVIVSEGTEIECSAFFPAMYKFGTDWFANIKAHFQSADTPDKMEIKSTAEWNFKALKGIAHKGIYSDDDVRSYTKSVNEPLNELAYKNNFQRHVNGKFNPGSRGTGSGYFTSEATEELSVTFLQKAHEGVMTFGSYAGAIFAVFWAFRTIKFFFDMAFNGVLVYNLFGVTWRVCFACWDSVVHVMIDKEKVERNKHNGQNF